MTSDHLPASHLTLSGGNGVFRWTPVVGGGVFAFEGTNYRGSHAPQLLAWHSIYVVTSGTVAVRRADDEWLATTGSVVLLSPFEVHEKKYALQGSICGVFPVTLAGPKVGALSAAPLRMWKSPVVDDPVLASLILEMYAAIDTSTRAVKELRWRDLLQRLSLYACTDPDRAHAGEHRCVSRVRAYLHASRHTIPSMADLANVAGLSRFHMSRIFRAHVGLSPYAYFEQVRLARARYLIHGGATLARAAFTLGFSDQSHLTRQFSALLSTTPGQYARAVRAARKAAVTG